MESAPSPASAASSPAPTSPHRLPKTPTAANSDNSAHTNIYTIVCINWVFFTRVITTIITINTMINCLNNYFAVVGIYFVVVKCLGRFWRRLECVGDDLGKIKNLKF
jgi:hypothetical protein